MGTVIHRWCVARSGGTALTLARVETASDGSQKIVAFTGINLGFAAKTDPGMVVPSPLRSAKKLSDRDSDEQIPQVY
ncbi:hypothetical protein ACLKOZ_18210 [Arthrobacter sp. R4]